MIQNKRSKMQHYDPSTYANVGIPVVGTLLADYKYELGRSLSEQLNMTKDELEAICLIGAIGFTPTSAQAQGNHNIIDVLQTPVDRNYSAQLWFRVPLELLGKLLKRFYDRWLFSQQGENWTLKLNHERAPMIQPTINRQTKSQYSKHKTVKLTTDLFIPRKLDTKASRKDAEKAAKQEVSKLGINPEALKLRELTRITSPETGHYLEGYGVEISGPFGTNAQGYRIRSVEKLLTWGLGQRRLFGCGVFFFG